MGLISLTISEVNSLVSEHFIKIFGNVVEHCPAAAIGILKYRPFNSTMDIYKAIVSYIDGLSINEKQNLLYFHPDFVSQLINLSRLQLENSPKKMNQTISLDMLPISEKRRLNTLNDRYKEKFGFPFVIFGKRNIDLILNEMEKRMENSPEKEIELAIQEVKKISRVRIHELIKN
ncbi:2-oxo-4-hydroxy-4-carboxy-5-ureidoimidazoline decarboxylase-like [Coccinella septempunctata]|uniref:2-oxo-4-hydroxy-4-carboxy-5-ureidoimidazoline decarboxylase-like n=1 Tax=Coccinella septempunctata TaxID=41139 RepID=UPI001D06921E|nr:2-oxo-4-hydroxy-4-carboxy-5-ureidoimidazoline decarboxylase-like [Coccinella septempunctata]